MRGRAAGRACHAAPRPPRPLQQRGSLKEPRSTGKGERDLRASYPFTGALLIRITRLCESMSLPRPFPVSMPPFETSAQLGTAARDPGGRPNASCPFQQGG